MTRQVIGDATLLRGDCLERMAEIESGSVDLVLTDPPYGMDFQSNWSKKGPRHKKIIGDAAIDSSWLPEVYRLMKPDGGLLMFCDWRTSCQWRLELENAGLKINSQVIWNRLHHGMGDLQGAFAPMHDVIWYATKGRRTFKNGRPKSVIEDRRPSPSEDNGHPTCKPIKLITELTEYCSSPGEVILDPFMGSGTTGVACTQTGRRFIGIERDENYFNIACGRILEAYIDAVTP